MIINISVIWELCITKSTEGGNRDCRYKKHPGQNDYDESLGDMPQSK